MMPDQIHPVLAKVWLQFREMIFHRVAVLEDAANGAKQGELDDEVRQSAMREAHKLAGSLGTFGLMEGTRIAREIEHFLEDPANAWPAATRQFVDLVAALDRELAPHRPA
jgi:HPt (histidine-containing phosphotransfer) domain-containing protein